LNGVAEHGPGYELPSSFTLKSRVIPDIKKEVAEYVKNVIRNSVKTGYTLMCQKRDRPLMCKKRLYPHDDDDDDDDDDYCYKLDIFAYTPIGMVFASPPMSFFSNFKENMSGVMMLFPPANAVQFIIDDKIDPDNPIVHILTNEYPRIFRTPCATRGIRLLLQKIAHVPFVDNILKVANWIVSYIFKHKVNVSLSTVHQTKSDVASPFSNLKSLLKVESELQALQVSIVGLSSDREKLLSDAKAYEVAKFIDSAIRCKEFWSRGKMVEQVMKPLFQVLDLVHCDGPTFGYLYEMMERVHDEVEESCGSNKILYVDILKILKEVRSDIIHPIHAAAALLNPIYMCHEKFEDNDEMIGVKKIDEMMDGVKKIGQILVGLEEEDAFMSQVQLYRSKDPNLFTDQAMMMLKTTHPREFSKFYIFHW